MDTRQLIREPYLLVTGVTPANAAAWIALCAQASIKSVVLSQFLRPGDFVPLNNLSDLDAGRIVRKFQAAGIAVGLRSFSYLVAKDAFFNQGMLLKDKEYYGCYAPTMDRWDNVSSALATAWYNYQFDGRLWFDAIGDKPWGINTPGIASLFISYVRQGIGPNVPVEFSTLWPYLTEFQTSRYQTIDPIKPGKTYQQRIADQVADVTAKAGTRQKAIGYLFLNHPNMQATPEDIQFAMDVCRANGCTYSVPDFTPEILATDRGKRIAASMKVFNEWWRTQ